MVLLPLMLRELRVQTRRSKAWWLRLLAGGFTFACWAVPVLLHGIDVTNGRMSFFLLSLFPLLFASFTGIFATADMISKERREGTLGLLFLTRVHPMELIASKFISGVWQWVVCLLAILPMFLLPVLIGGVNGQEVIVMMALLISVCFLSASIGLFVSSLTRSAVTATVWTFMFLAGWFCLGTVLAVGFAVGPTSTLTSFSPPHLYFSLIGSKPAAWLDITPIPLALLLPAFILLISARCIVPATVEPIVRRPSQNRAIQRAWFYGLLVTIILPVILSLVDPSWPRRIFKSNLLGFIIIALHTLVKLALTTRATRSFSNKRWLETVLTTPIAIRELIWIEFKSLLVVFGLLTGSMLVVDLIVFHVVLPKSLAFSWFRFYLPLSALLLLADSIALCWSGLWHGAKSKTVNEAAGNAISQVLGSPLVIAFFLYTAGVHTSTLYGGLFLWTLLALGVDALCGSASAYELRTRLRQVAAG
jgi:ABC-type transport system involved in multi-copper enzyme maturation permease subunit